MQRTKIHVNVGDLVQVKWRNKAVSKGIIIKVENSSEGKWKGTLPSPPACTLTILNEMGKITYMDVWDQEEVEIIQSFTNHA